MGKDTSVDFLVQYYKPRRTIKLSFAKVLKDATGILFNLTEEQLYDPIKKEIPITNFQLDGKETTPRILLQWLGTDILRKYVHEDFFVEHMKQNIEIHRKNHDYIFTTDVRFDNEAKFVKG